MDTRRMEILKLEDSDLIPWATRYFHVDRKEDSYHGAQNESATTSAATLHADTLDNGQKREIAILANTLANMVPSSQDLASSIPAFSRDVLLSLQRISGTFLCGQRDDSIQQDLDTVDSSKPLDSNQSRPVSTATQELVDTLFLITKAPDISPSIWTEAAITISKLLEHSMPPRDLSFLIKRIDENASLLISVLSTSSLASSTFSSKEYDPIESLYLLSAVSKTVLQKIVKRRCAVIAVARRLGNSNHWTTDSALDFCSTVFSDAQCVDFVATGAEDNLQILLKSILELVRNDAVVQHQIAGMEILSLLPTLKDYQTENILDTLEFVAFKSQSRDASIKSVTIFCQIVKEQEQPSFQSLKTLVEFSNFPQGAIRVEALKTLELQISAEYIQNLLEHSDLLEIICRNIRCGSGQERTVVFDITRQMARSSSCHALLCSHEKFLKNIVTFIVRQNESCHPSAEEILISLLLNKGNTKHFLSFPDLLTWLVEFLNQNENIVDEDIGQNLVAVAIGLS